jgi:hypothetical protein
MVWMIIYILFWHWVSDFVAQTDEMAKGKSTSNKWLTKHIVSYGNHMLFGSLPFLVFGIIIGVNLALPIVSFILINCLLHWVTDYFTSRWTSRLWKEQDVHNFFVVIGLDQFIHMFCLITTYYFLITF